MHPGYGRLVELAERELALVRAEAWEALAALWDDRRAVVAGLPGLPPADARGALERAASLQGQVTALLEERLGAVGADMRRLVRGRAAMHSYAPRVARVPLVDRAG
jgi:hypothetical protein